MTHEELSALCGPYALGALDGEELAAVSAHLPECWDCRQRVLEFEETFAEGAKVLPPLPPSPQVKRRILERISGPTAAVAKPAEEPPAEAPPPAPPPVHPRPLGLALLALAALLLGVVGGHLLETPASPSQDSSLLALLRDPALASAPLEPSGRVLWAGDQVAVVAPLPAPGAGQSYALWALEDAGPRLLGRFRLAQGWAILGRGGQVSTAFAVSREAERGPLTAPAGPILLKTP